MPSKRELSPILPPCYTDPKMADCLFCKIIKKEIPSRIAHEEPDLLAFYDINPQAPTHIVLVPKTHLERVSDLTPETAPLMGKLVLTANQLARKLGFSEKGYRLVVNCNRDGGQTVFHLHLHLLH